MIEEAGRRGLGSKDIKPISKVRGNQLGRIGKGISGGSSEPWRSMIRSAYVRNPFLS
jgi:hypothetical protein